MGRWSVDHVVALVWAACGAGLAAYLVALGAEGPVRGGVFDVLAVVALVGFGAVAVRVWRRAGAARPGTTASDDPGGSTPSRPTTPDAHGSTGPSATGRPPSLSRAGQDEVARVVGILDRAGLFRPRCPDPVDLTEAVADQGEPVTVDAVLAAVEEAGYWRPGFAADDHLGAIVFHASHVEQCADSLRDQVDDLDGLIRDTLRVRPLAVDLRDGGRAVEVRLRLALGDREETLAYRGRAKDLSTVLHVAVARALTEVEARAPGTARPRLAWTWSDQGVWLAALRTTGVDALNADLGDALAEPWEWVDEQEPMAAGDL